MPPDPLTWFVDRCLGKKLVRELRARGVGVEWHGDHFDDDADDAVWIPFAASRGWPILTKDKKIRRDAVERRAVMTNAAVFVCLGGGSMTADDQIACVGQNWDALVALVHERHPPRLITITKIGLQEYDMTSERWVRVARPRRSRAT